MTATAARQARTVVTVLSVVAVVLLVVAVVLGFRVRDDASAEAAQAQQDRIDVLADADARQRERADVLAVASKQASNLTSLSSSSFEAGLASVRALSTGAFLAELDKTVASLKAQLAASTFQQTGTLIDAGVVEIQDDKASVILALDQVITSGQKSRTDALRLQVDLLRTGAGAPWLVDNVIFQPSSVAAQTLPAPTTAPTASPTAPAPTPTTSPR